MVNSTVSNKLSTSRAVELLAVAGVVEDFSSGSGINSAVGNAHNKKMKTDRFQGIQPGNMTAGRYLY